MFYYLKGTLAMRGENFAVVDVGGAGYKIYTSLRSLSETRTGAEATFYTYVYVREDILDIYGFVSAEELKYFELLIGISGVGPKAALAILSALSPSEIAGAAISGESKSFTRAQGVGSKIAQRIVLELKGKIATEDIAQDAGFAAPSASDNTSEAAQALVQLGYSAIEARRAVAFADPDASVEEIIKKALQSLMK